MIQRIQSIFLVLAMAAMLVASAFNIWLGDSSADCATIVNSLNIGRLCGGEFSTSKNIIYLLAIQIAFALIALYSILSYKNRKRQILLGGANSLLGSVFLLLTFFVTKEISETESGGYGLGFFLPLLAIFLNILANRFIKKDEKLVRSLDRIR